MTTVAAIGPLNIDLIYSGLNRLPQPGEEVYYPRFELQLGGGPPVLPIALSHFGIKTRLGTFLGNDVPSHMAKRLLSDLGIRRYRNFYKSKTKSPVVVTSVLSLKNDRCFASYGEDRVLSLPAETVYNFYRGARVCFALPDHPNVMQKLRREGSLVIYDAGWTEHRHISQMTKALQFVDIYTPNDKEAMKITGAATPEKALKKLSRVVPFPVITLGKSGCMALHSGKIHRLKMPKHFRAVDTTGAGDNFLAGVAYGLCKKWSLLECLKAGNVFGGLSTTQLGCYQGLRSANASSLHQLMGLHP